MPGVGRFRVNLLRQRSSFMIVMRVIPFDVPTFESLGLPPVLATLTAAEHGLVLVTGGTGSGKSSTMAAMVNHINQTQQRHVLTLESPIEFLHRDVNSSVTQREVGVDTDSVRAGLRAALRQDPDVIMIGEMRDTETIDMALKAGETGHLLISAVHTPDVLTTINRLIATFPPEEQEVTRLRLAETLQAVVSQRLVHKAEGEGQVVAVEILISTGVVRDMIQNPERTIELPQLMRASREQYGMQTFDQHLLELLSEGIVTREGALAVASDPSEFELLLRTVHRRAAPAAKRGP
jgi:twitching motility protein PilT